MTHDTKTFFLALAVGLPAVAVTLALLWTGDLSSQLRWTLGIFVTSSCLVTALIVRSHVTKPLQTISNMLSALHSGDYSIRARPNREDDALGLVISEVNTLGDNPEPYPDTAEGCAEPVAR